MRRNVRDDVHLRPILFLDVDGVISLFGFAPGTDALPGRFHWVDGVSHCLSHQATEHLIALSERFELVWATGWEEKANEYLPHLLDLPFHELPVLSFEGRAVFGTAHWKLAAIEKYAGDRPAAWIDDSIDETCLAWAKQRQAPTLIVETDSPVGMTGEHVELLLSFADSVS